MTPPLPLCLHIPSRLEYVGPLGERVRAACAAFGMASDAAGEVELSVVEMVNNAIEHGYQMAGTGWVEVSLESDGRQLHIEISDGGRALPPAALAAAALPEVNPARREDLPERGLGLAIAKRLMDAVRYHSSPGCNVLTLERQIQRPGFAAEDPEVRSDR